MWELVKAGGWTMVPLLLLGVLALAIVLERFWTLRRNEVLPSGLGQEVRNWAARGKLDPSHIQSLRANSPVAAGELAAGGVAGRRAGGAQPSARPVVGMIQMFLGILDHGVGDVNQLAGGIGKALVCTATGMIVAIPALMFHRYFKGRIGGYVIYVIEMEQEASALLDALDGRPGVMNIGAHAPAAASPAPVTAKS